VLTTTGPYGYVRHPLYVGNHLITLGFCLASGLVVELCGLAVIGLFFYPARSRMKTKCCTLFGQHGSAGARNTRTHPR